MNKVCIKCSHTKKFSFFYKKISNKDGFNNICKKCVKHKQRIWNSQNKEFIKERNKKYCVENKETLLQKKREFYQHNKEQIKAQQKEYRSINHKWWSKRHKKWASENPEKLRENAKVHHIKHKEEPQYHLRKVLRSRLKNAIKGNFKSGSAVRDLGCSISDLKKYLESKFQQNMTWNNHGKWHIDHILPLSKFDLTDREQFLKSCHYTNLQPLWAADNLRKSNKIEVI